MPSSHHHRRIHDRYRVLGAHGGVVAIGVEGTASYGTGFTRAARAEGLSVVEVNRPDRAERRRSGKSDPINAYAAARAALSGRASSAPEDETVTGTRAPAACVIFSSPIPRN
ncbi:hypothetical protein [Streptomyces sp. NPDC054849]